MPDPIQPNSPNQPDPELGVFETKRLIAELRRRRGINPAEIDDIVAAIDKLELGDLGSLKRQVDALWGMRTRALNSLTPEERALLEQNNYMGCVKAVRERCGVGLADAKALVDKWKGGL